MVCRVDSIDAREDAVLVSHHPISVFTTGADHLDKIQSKPDGHYDREDMTTLVTDGRAVLFNENAVRAIAKAAGVLIFGCLPAR